MRHIGQTKAGLLDLFRTIKSINDERKAEGN